MFLCGCGGYGGPRGGIGFVALRAGYGAGPRGEPIVAAGLDRPFE